MENACASRRRGFCLRRSGEVRGLLGSLERDSPAAVARRECSRQKDLDNASVAGTFREVSRNLSEITEEALRLPRSAQLRLARTLLESSEAVGDTGAETAWEEEIERRIQKVDAGLAKGRPFSDVLRDIDRRLGR